MEKYGLSFSLRALKESKPEVWERIKDDFNDIKIEDEEKVYFNDFTKHMQGRTVFHFLQELIPDELKKELEGPIK
ncbi:hypothetical protein [Cytobacillus solani]|uniref:Uncharacterized protein n=1 Tax=Cytobacillus solani TaxID=1637975 RepID=A0A0Q3VHI1_9BACI|nr:hypothetical protein [Cytobacillus solani]KQL19087.1 hypothetical protein AN957_11160 [Cytobacillus solani]